MTELFDVNAVFFILFTYKMSYIEFFSTVFSLLSVYLMTRQNIWTWPCGLIGVVLFAVIFYKIQLYADFMEQVYYFFVCCYGWWLWVAKKQGGKHSSAASFSRPSELLGWVLLTALVSIIFCLFLARIHVLLPVFFPQPATFVWVDGITTIMGFVAMVLQARRRSENWIYWIVVNIASIWLYYVKDIKFVSGLYFVYLILAFVGLSEWLKAQRKTAKP